MPDDDQADLYELTQDVCNRLGLPAYEVSNHAATNTAKSQHNLTYWRGGDWIGIGPGAHGRLSMRGQRYATLGPLKPAAYVEASTDIRPRSWEALASLDAARELLALGLRPDTGFDLERVSQLTGISVSQTTVDHFASSGLVAVNGSTIKLTPSGRLLADRIAAELSP
jgi:oxygen-independent coproporphyrinogen-3 oxidase